MPNSNKLLTWEAVAHALAKRARAAVPPCETHTAKPDLACPTCGMYEALRVYGVRVFEDRKRKQAGRR